MAGDDGWRRQLENTHMAVSRAWIAPDYICDEFAGLGAGSRAGVGGRIVPDPDSLSFGNTPVTISP